MARYTQRHSDGQSTVGANRAAAFVATAWLAMALLIPLVARAGAESQIERLLNAPEPPPGVVFEIAGSDPDALGELLPGIREYVQRLRRRFPALEIAVVTHGVEQFALQTERRSGNEQVHRQVQSLVGEQNVPVHVCETFASWRGIGAEEFPEYVQVAPSGPAQVRAYRELGYEVVQLP